MNKETKGVIAQLQALGLIDEENKVTVQGIDVLTRYAEQSEDNDNEDWGPEYLKVWDADEEAIKKWQDEHCGIVINGEGEGCMEVSVAKWVNADTGEYCNYETIAFCVKDDYGFNDVLLHINTTKDAIKLRNHLTKIIERNIE